MQEEEDFSDDKSNNEKGELVTWGPVTMAASNMMSSKGEISRVATRQRPLPALQRTLRYRGIDLEHMET
jgi:hypothetical protein